MRKKGGARPGAGRKTSEATKLRREYLNKQHTNAVEALEYCMVVVRSKAEETRDRLAAAKIVQDRVWGKAKQSVILGVPDESGIEGGGVFIGFGRPDDA